MVFEVGKDVGDHIEPTAQEYEQGVNLAMYRSNGNLTIAGLYQALHETVKSPRQMTADERAEAEALIAEERKKAQTTERLREIDALAERMRARNEK
ncbi:hypothetical protein [Photobacterium alginatilyticum]|uniref:Uncharacterized protein n=1 Tax=Photobacterium alginatilyticum TaxID=1775171 RepID=A0ABW9YJP3_9GAMM|nr:hypothetical protein [Photobacterium alginatilyticum]NBI53448.1 hypothetical protein [Photobacterium alginatilyticum]